MKKNNRLFFYTLLILSALSLFSQSSSHAITDTITIASEPDYPPYCFVDENGKAAGFSIDLFNAVADAVGLKVNIKVGIWSKIKKDLAEGKIDALPLVGRTPEREELFDFTMPYISLHGAVFVRKGTKDINSLADLKNKSIVVMKGDNAEEFVRRGNISNEIVTTKTFEEAFIALAKGHHDAVITQRVMGIELLNEIGIKNVVPLDFHIPQYRQDFCFAVQKGNAQLLSRLNEGLSIIIANDTFEDIRDEWFGPTLKEKISFTDVLRYMLFIVVPLIIIIAIIAVFVMQKIVRSRTRDLNQEIIKHKNTLQALKVSEQKYRNMVINLMEGFYSVTLDGKLLDYNNEFVKIFHLDPEKDHTNTNLPDFWQNPEERKPYVEEILSNGILKNYEVKAKTIDGQNIVVLVNSRLVKNGQDEPVRIEGSFLDISDRKKTLQELQKVKENLEETVKQRTAELEEKVQKLHKSEKAMLYMVEDLNQLTSELKEERQKLLTSNKELEAFSYTVSHDLRAPLRAIFGFTNILQEEYYDILDSEAKRIFNIILENTNRMDKLINDLLQFSRTGRQQVTHTEVDTKALIVSLINGIMQQNKDRKIKFIKKDMHSLYADKMLISQAFENILTNAVKFTQKKEKAVITIDSQVKDDEIVYSIRDNGIGFDMKYAPKIFEVFQRLHTVAEFEGTGIGLAIVKKVIHKHHGHLWVESKQGEGTTFFFSLPNKKSIHGGIHGN